MITLQDFFNSAWKNVTTREQWRCSTENGFCNYRDPNDPTFGCFVGQGLIDKGLMTDKIATFNGGVHGLRDAVPELKMLYKGDWDALRSLQYVHDNGIRTEVDMKTQLKHFAKEHKLEIPE